MDWLYKSYISNDKTRYIIGLLHETKSLIDTLNLIYNAIDMAKSDNVNKIMIISPFSYFSTEWLEANLEKNRYVEEIPYNLLSEYMLRINEASKTTMIFSKTSVPKKREKS